MDTQPHRDEGPRAKPPPTAPVAAPTFDLDEFQARSMAQLLAAAETAGLSDTAGLDRQELVFALQQHSCPAPATGLASGILEIRPEGFGFLRSVRHMCQAGADDVYVSPNQIQRLGLRQGQALSGIIRSPRPGESYYALLRVSSIEGIAPAGRRRAVPLRYLTPVLPSQSLSLSYPGCPDDLRLIDLLSPLGLGQRILLAAPPGSRRNEILRHVAAGVLRQRQKAQLVVLLVDQRPEEAQQMVADLEDEARATVLASTFDAPPERHASLCRLVQARVERMVEAGREVVLLVDSLTQLTRAENDTVPHSGKIVSAGLDSTALRRPKELFCSARQTEEGPSLTVLASLLVDGDVQLDRAIADEFAGKANAEIVLAPELVAAGQFPAFDVHRCGTRFEDELLGHEVAARTRALRQDLRGKSLAAAWHDVVAQVRNSRDNAELLTRLADA